MAKKSKKINKSCPNKATPWPDLPQQLCDIISKQPTLLQNMSYGGVEKSWSFVPKPCNLVQKPTLPQLYSKNDQKTDKPNIFDIKIRKHRWYSLSYQPCDHRDYNVENFMGYSEGFLMGKEPDELWCYLWDPLANLVTLLPQWKNNIPIKHVALSLLPKDYPYTRHLIPDTKYLVVVTGISHPAFMFRKVASFRCSHFCPWSPLDCPIIDPHSSTQKHMQFTNVIGLDGKFYALSLQGTLVVLEVSGPFYDGLRIIGVSSSRAVPTIPSLNFKEWLINSNGVILLVFLISTKKADVVDMVEIYRLSIATLKWVKVEKLGDTALFFGVHCCMHVSASKIGSKGSCVYFTDRAGGGWFVYDMAKGDISPSYMTCL